MKKLLLIAITLLFFIPNNTNAAMCTSEGYDKLKQEAYNLKFTYELETPYTDIAYYTVTISALTSNVMVDYEGVQYRYNTSNEDPAISEMADSFIPGETYEFSIYGTKDSDCSGSVVYTKKITFPYYNLYHSVSECLEYPDFELCKSNYTGEIESDDYFYEELDKYIAELGNNKKDDDKTERTSFFQKAIDFYLDYKYISIPLTILIVVAVSVLIIHNVNRSRKRVKIDLEGKKNRKKA